MMVPILLLALHFTLHFTLHPASAADLPNPALTPGAHHHMTLDQLCTTKWGKDARKVTQAMKRQVFEAYNLSGNHDPSCSSPRHFEIDHLIPRELAGADTTQNLWPQCYSGKWNATMKDRLENRLHHEVCSGTITLETAQNLLTKDWRIPYKFYFQKPD